MKDVLDCRFLSFSHAFMRALAYTNRVVVKRFLVLIGQSTECMGERGR